MGSMSAAHWLIVLVVVLLVFGPKRLASLGKGMGEGIRSFREGLAGDNDEHRQAEERTIEKDKASRDQAPRDQAPY
jgi:sec-independent protein translocase protein TatA